MDNTSAEIVTPVAGAADLPFLKGGTLGTSSPSVVYTSRSPLSCNRSIANDSNSSKTSYSSVQGSSDELSNSNLVEMNYNQAFSESDSTTMEEEPITGGSLRVKRDWHSTMLTFTAGGVAGITSRTLTAPFDRIKIIVQEGYLTHLPAGQHPMSTSKNARLRDVAKMIYRDGGVRGFWRGNFVNCCKASPEFALVFSLRHYLFSMYEDIVERDEKRLEQYEQLRQMHDSTSTALHGQPFSVSPPAPSCISRIPRLGVNCLIGAGAGLGAQSLLYPLEVVKTRVCVSRNEEFRSGGVRTIIREAYQQGGMKEFYKGFSPNMIGIVFYRGLELGIYSSIQQSVMLYRMKYRHCTRQESTLTVAEVGIAGMAASTVAQTVTYPLNVIRTRLQTQGTQGRTKRYNGTIDCFLKVLKQKGVRGLFSGLGANYIKAVPASSCAFVVFEKMQTVLLGEI